MCNTCLSQTVDKVTVNFKTINKRNEQLYSIVKVIKTRVKTVDRLTYSYTNNELLVSKASIYIWIIVLGSYECGEIPCIS